MRKNIINQSGISGLGSVTTINTPATSVDREIIVWDGTDASTLQGGGVSITSGRVIESPTAITFYPADFNPGNGSTVWVDTAGELYLGDSKVGGGDVVGPASSIESNLTAFDNQSGKLIKDTGIAYTEVVRLTTTQVLSGKTITGSTNLVHANGLRTATGSITTDSTTPTVGQVLKATSATTATWQEDIGGGDVSSTGFPLTNQICVFAADGGKTIKKTGITVDTAGGTPTNTLQFPNTAQTLITIGGKSYLRLVGAGFDATGVFLGTSAGGIGSNGRNNTGVGYQALSSNMDGATNTMVGASAGGSIDYGSSNTGVGFNVFGALVNGNDNIGIGYASGSNYEGGEIQNILIGHNGVLGEDFTMRLGTAVTRAFMAGVRGVVTGGTDRQMVVVDNEGQLGSQAIPSGDSVVSMSNNWTTAFSITSTNITMTLARTGRQVTLFIPAFTASLPTPAASLSIGMVLEAYRSGYPLSRSLIRMTTGGASVDCYAEVSLTQINFYKQDGSNFAVGDIEVDVGFCLNWITA